ncbi:MAG TPA: RNA polymerase sigma-70 factor [Puia sp.]|nr:RNA polymerase sigma-70 factor [Puia sp.]
MHGYDDNQLLALIKGGSVKAYEILFERYYRFLCLEASLFLLDQAEAEDVVLELFVEMWDKQIFRMIDRSIKAYLYRAIRNKCINALRKRKIVHKKQRQYEQRAQREGAACGIEQRELAASIHQVLQEFPAQRLRAFTLVYIEKKRYQEAAEEMGLSVNSVKTHLKLAIQVLRNKLDKFR